MKKTAAGMEEPGKKSYSYPKTQAQYDLMRGRALYRKWVNGNGRMPQVHSRRPRRTQG